MDPPIAVLPPMARAQKRFPGTDCLKRLLSTLGSRGRNSSVRQMPLSCDLPQASGPDATPSLWSVGGGSAGRGPEGPVRGASPASEPAYPLHVDSSSELSLNPKPS